MSENTTDKDEQQGGALLPCPFCGVVPVMQSHTQEDEMGEGRYLFLVECGNGKCPMGLVSTGGPFREQSKAETAWNSRASLAAVEGDADIRKMLKHDAWHCRTCGERFKYEGNSYSCEQCQQTWPAQNIVLFGYADLTDESFAAASSSLPAEPPPNHTFIVLSQDLFDALTTASHELKAAVEIGAANPIYAQALTIVDTMLKYDAHRFTAPAEPPQPEGEQECQRCGKTGGKVVSFNCGSLTTARWVCPYCLDALSARDAEIRAVLEGLRNGMNECWCPTEHQEDKHSPACLAARELYAKLQPAKESSDG